VEYFTSGPIVAAVFEGTRAIEAVRATVGATNPVAAGAGDLLGDGARLLRIASVIADEQCELLAKHAAGSVEIGNRLFGTVLQLASECGFAAGHRTGNGDGDVLRECGG